MVSMQDQDAVHGAFQHRIHFVLFARRGKHHVQEVTRIGEIVARIDKRLADRIFVTHRCHRRHFRKQTECCDFAVALNVYIQRIVVKRSQCTSDTAHYRHRMRIATEAVEQAGNLLMNHGVAGNRGTELIKLFLVWCFAVQQDVADFQIVRVGRQLRNRETTVQQDTFIPIDKGDCRFAGRGRRKTGIEGEQAT